MHFIEGESGVGYTLMAIMPSSHTVFKVWARKPARIVMLWTKAVLWLKWFGR